MSEHVILIASVGVIIASVAVVVTFVGILLSNKRTNESNNLTRKLVEADLRPRIRMTSPDLDIIVLKDGSMIEIEEYNKDPKKYLNPKFLRIKVVVVNEGKLHTRSVKGIWHQSTSSFDKNELRKKGRGIRSIPLIPGETFDHNYDFNFKPYVEFLKEKHTFGLEVDYEINQVTRVKNGKIWEIRNGVFHIIHSWIDE
ncbi:MAG: hypothetical protein IIC67_03265 [Thaumarchaeota archaeon]|nr:hypothetical protein [Nitrososphaerota archaeon]